MTHIHPILLQHEQKRFIRPDAHRFLRADWRRYMRVGRNDPMFSIFEKIERKYSPDQPRVPRGSSNGGQWTSEGASGPRIIFDAASDRGRQNTQYAQNRPRGGFASVIINGQQVEPTPGQQARLAVVEAQARDAMQRVKEVDPRWQPTPSAYESVEGLIRSYESDVAQARNRIFELQQVGIGPGPFAGDSIPARGPERDFISGERGEINRIGSETGCHTCGTMNPGTPLENFVVDHQPPTAWNPLSRSQRLYPQCWSCSSKQGNWISRNGGRR